MKVLVIEDNLIDLKLAHAVLDMSGYVVRDETSAEDALKAIGEDKPDVILLDLNLPGMDGIAFLRQLKGKTETAQIPILAVTAYPSRYRYDDLLAAGCSACIFKPIDTRALSAKLLELANEPSR